MLTTLRSTGKHPAVNRPEIHCTLVGSVTGIIRTVIFSMRVKCMAYNSYYNAYLGAWPDGLHFIIVHPVQEVFSVKNPSARLCSGHQGDIEDAIVMALF